MVQPGAGGGGGGGQGQDQPDQAAAQKPLYHFGAGQQPGGQEEEEVRSGHQEGDQGADSFY